MINKLCPKCKEIKSINNFGHDKNRINKHQSYCKLCRNITMKEWRLNNSERDRLTQIKSYTNNSYKYRLKQINRSKQWKLNNPKAVIAHILISKAIKSGKLKHIDKCEFCNKIKNTIAHHDDYNFPMKIKWVCRSCHRHIHNNTIFQHNSWSH